MEDFESYFCFDCTKKHPFLIQKPDNWISLGISNGNEKIHQWVINTTTNTTGQKRKLDQVDIDDTITTNPTTTDNDDNENNKKSEEENEKDKKGSEKTYVLKKYLSSSSPSSCKRGNKTTFVFV